MIEAALLVGSPERCRLLSQTEVRSSPDLVALREKQLSSASGDDICSDLEFDEPGIAALAARLISVQLTPHKPSWRFTLPNLVLRLMQVRPGDSVAVLISRI